MPKGGHHHLHLTAAAPIDFLIELTYDSRVSYNMRDNIFKVDKTAEDSGYISCNELRNFHATADEFDSMLKEKILLTKEEIKSQESECIWDIFQYKFLMTNDLYNYAPFFEKIVMKIFEICVAENIFICELRHIFGFVFDDDRQSLPVENELKIFHKCVQKMKAQHGLFDCKIIACGLKALGKDHCQKEIDDTHEAFTLEDYKYLVAGYDMVNEEDTTPPIEDFAQMIMDAQEKQEEEFPCFFHAGESDFSCNTNLYDALLLGTKRIGHGFNIALHPKLVEYVIREGICLEVCPISNFVLAYTLDLRNHPARALINQGLNISLNSDDPGFYGYSGVSLDYAFALLSWELGVADLKQLALNGINFSSLDAETKVAHLEKFEEDWNTFIKTFIAKN